MSSAPATTVTPTLHSLGGFSEAAFEAFLQSRDEPSWLIDRRREAFARLLSTPWPTARDEEWRRTDIRGLKLDAFAAPTDHGISAEEIASVAPSIAALAEHSATGIVQINSVLHQKADDSRLGGAHFMSLAEAAKAHPEVLSKYLLNDPATLAADAFSALHSAFWTGGTVLYVPKGVKVEAPLYSLVTLAGGGKVDLDHTLVILDEGAEATLVRETSSRNRVEGAALHVGGVELFVGPGAKLRFVNIQNWDDQTWHFSRERAYIERDAEIQWTVGGLGSRIAKVNQDVALQGQGANAQVNGVLFTSGKQHLAYFTRQDHIAPHTTSDLLYKGGLKDRSRIVWKGMIKVEKDAQRTNAYQKDDNLVLSDQARADSIPGLEIEANDVRCTHGATAGRVDEEMMFYAQARGIDRPTAIRLIVEGFFANVYDRITLEPVRETLRQAVAAKLANR